MKAISNHHYSDWTENCALAEAVKVEKADVAANLGRENSTSAQSQGAVPGGPRVGVQYRAQLHRRSGAWAAQSVV